MELRVLLAVIVMTIVASGGGVGSDPQFYDPLSKDIMSDQIFMTGMWHMAVEEIDEAPKRLTVTTTGVVFEFSPGTDRLLCRHRLGEQRRGLLLRFPTGALAGLKVTARGTGAAILQSDGGMQFKVNCDSLLMMRSSRPSQVYARVLWQPVKEYSHGPHRLLLDPYGAVGLFPIEGASLIEADSRRYQYRYELPEGSMLWASVGPPRPYPWERSLSEQVIWTYAQSEEWAIPDAERIAVDSQYGNILWLQAEVMLWRSWQTGFVPRLPQKFAQMVETAHEQGLRVIIYASPYYFVKGTDQEKAAVDMAPSFKESSFLTTATGSNLAWYLEEARKALTNLGVDGLYFDGVYNDSVKNNYILLRSARELLGERRLLFVHDTVSAPGGVCYNPSADTWADFHLRGEGRRPFRPDYLRWFVSCYNISNSIGFVCNNVDSSRPTREQVEMTLAANCRFPYFSDSPSYLQPLPDWYWPRLDQSYRAFVEKSNQQPWPEPIHYLEQPTVLPPPRDVPDLTEHQISEARSAALVMETFGVGTPEYDSLLTLNGVPVGPFPYWSDDSWMGEQVVVDLPPEARKTLAAVNQLVIRNPDNDSFKVRRIYIRVTLEDGQYATSNMIGGVYCSNETWAHAEGESVALGEPIKVRIPFAVE